MEEITIGDLNVSVGNKNEGVENIMGREEENARNNNEDNKYLSRKNLIITNTSFRHKDIHKLTRKKRNRREIDRRLFPSE